MDTEECILPILPAVRSQSISTEVPVKEKASVGDNVTQSPKVSAARAESKTMPSHDGDHREVCCRKFQISHPMELRCATSCNWLILVIVFKFQFGKNVCNKIKVCRDSYL